MKLGLEVFLQKHISTYKGKRIGLLTNITGVNHALETTIDLFYNHPDIELRVLYGPEHGIRGEVKEGEWVDSTVDPTTKLPIYSLYSKEKDPSSEMLSNIDVVVCDLQDIGSRYYTFIYTVANMMKLCGQLGKQVVILDRPNPINGTKVEGNLVEPNYTSFVGQFPIPVRHGLTIGELALLFKHEFHIDCELEVIQMEGWGRAEYFDETDLFWVPPSPNATSVDMCLLYPGTCLIEGTNLSEGRGTTKPFEIFGAPFINGQQLSKEIKSLKIPGIMVRPTVFKPMYQKFAGEVCEGVQLHISDRTQLDSYALGINVLETLYNLYPDNIDFIKSEDFNGATFLDLLAGSNQLREQLITGNATQIFDRLPESEANFHRVRKDYLLY